METIWEIMWETMEFFWETTEFYGKQLWNSMENYEKIEDLR